MINVFFADTQINIEGTQYPACWTETVTETQVDPDTQEETQVEVRKLKAEFDGYPKRPDICGTYQSKTVFYLAMDGESEATQLQTIKDAGAYLCSSYEQMAMLDMDLYRGVMECYQDDQRIKLNDYTGELDEVRVYAPVKVAGVEVQDKPDEPQEQFPTVIDRMSQAELYFREMKEIVKARSIAFIKANPDCTQDDLLAHLSDQALQATLILMLPYYINGAYQASLIQEATFEAFRNFVAVTPEAVLVSL